MKKFTKIKLENEKLAEKNKAAEAGADAEAVVGETEKWAAFSRASSAKKPLLGKDMVIANLRLIYWWTLSIMARPYFNH